MKEFNRRTVRRSPEPEPEDPPRGEDQAGECGAQGGSHRAQGPAPQVSSYLLFLIWRKISWQIFQCFVSLLLQCSGSMTFW